MRSTSKWTAVPGSAWPVIRTIRAAAASAPSHSNRATIRPHRDAAGLAACGWSALAEVTSAGCPDAVSARSSVPPDAGTDRSTIVGL